MQTNKTLLLIVILLGLTVAGAIGWITTQEYKGAQKHSDPINELVIDTEDLADEQADPVYFIAVHNEPYNSAAAKSEVELENAFNNLVNMIDAADEQNIKLTLMFSASWADYILTEPIRTRIFESWVAAGHEIAGHHHGLTHGAWDGYSALPELEAIQTRAANKDGAPEPYQGTLKDYSTELKRLNPAFNSGCMNEENNKQEMPDDVIYSTCSGYSNYSNDIVEKMDQDSVLVGDNQLIVSAMINDHMRYWISHYNIGAANRAIEAIAYFDQMEAGAFGMVLHSTNANQSGFEAALKTLKQVDPNGNQSRTMKQIFESNTLPTLEVSEEFFQN